MGIGCITTTQWLWCIGSLMDKSTSLSSHLLLIKLSTLEFTCQSPEIIGIHSKAVHRWARKKAYASDMPKSRSYIRLDSRKFVPFEDLQEFHSQSGEPFQLSWESTVTLWDYVIEAERGFISKEDWEYQNTRKKVASTVSSYISRWTSLEQGQNQIYKLQVLQEKVRSLAAVVDKCLD